MSDRKALTFVVVRDQDEVRRIGDELTPWLNEHLVRRCLLVAAADVIGVEDPKGVWSDGDGAAVSCRNALAAESYQTIRVVAFQQLRRGSAGDTQTVIAARKLGEAFKYSIAAAQRLVVLNILAPDDRVRDLPPDLLELGISANVVVAPEDRESPVHASHPLDDPDQLALHALMSLLVIAALWRHQVDGPLDGEQSAAFNEIPHVVVVRGYGRIARAPRLVENIARAVFAHRRTAQWAADAVGGVAARDPETIARRQVERFLERHGAAMSFDAPRPPPPPQLERVGVFKAFAMMFSFIVNGLKTLPTAVAGRITESARRAIGDMAQSVTFGEGSRIQVTGATSRSKSADDVASATRDLAVVLLERAGGASPTAPAAGEAWQDLRAVVFALHDGSEFPGGFDRPSDGVVTEIITDVAVLAPDPAEGQFVLDDDIATQLPPTARVPINPCDALQAQHVATELDGVEGGEDERGRLDAWVESRNSSLLWRLAAHVGDQFLEAQAVFGAALARVRKGPASVEGALAEGYRRTLLRRWSTWSTVVVLAVALGLYLYLRTPFGTDVAPVWREYIGRGGDLYVYAALALVTYAIGMTWAFVVYLRQMFRLQHRIALENADYQAAMTNAIDAAGALIRLAAMHEQVQDWAQIIGWMLHHPEGDLKGHDGDAEVEIGFRTPASHNIGVARWEEGVLRRLAAIVGRDLFGRSWLSNLFVRYRDDAMQRYKFEQGLDAGAPNPDPDWDPRSPGPRGYLLARLASREPGAAWTEETVGEIGQKLNAIDPNDLLDRVAGVSDETTAEEFLYGILADRRSGGEAGDLALFLWSNDARFYNRQRVDRTMVWSSNPISHTFGEFDRGEVASTRVTRRAVHDVLVVRMDQSAAVPYTDLALFVEAAAFQPVATASDEPASSKDW